MLYRLVVGNLSLSERIDRLDPFPNYFEQGGEFSQKIREIRVWIKCNTEKYFFSRKIFIRIFFIILSCTNFIYACFFFFFIKSDELGIFRDTMAKRVEMCMHIVNTE